MHEIRRFGRAWWFLGGVCHGMAAAVLILIMLD